MKSLSHYCSTPAVFMFTTNSYECKIVGNRTLANVHLSQHIYGENRVGTYTRTKNRQGGEGDETNSISFIDLGFCCIELLHLVIKHHHDIATTLEQGIIDIIFIIPWLEPFDYIHVLYIGT